jgi:hypothetical protein
MASTSDSEPWTVGVELELLAPRGRTRADLAHAIADAAGGRVRTTFLVQSEFAQVPGTPVFDNLTLGFAVENAEGEWLASCLDDLTLVDDLDPSAEARDGWYRILSDDRRLLHLIARQCDPAASRMRVLEPLAALFGNEIEAVESETIARVCDEQGATVALSVPLPGERERPCEVVTAPLHERREQTLTGLCNLAAGLGFSVPVEAATHVHFDGTRLKNGATIGRLVHVLGTYRSDLRRLVATNPRCRRLGDWPRGLYQTATRPAFAREAWPAVRGDLRAAGLQKYCDFNLLNLLTDRSEKQTFEVRILPGTMDPDFILRAIRLFEGLLDICIAGEVEADTQLPPLMTFISNLQLPAGDREYWLERSAGAARNRWFGFRRSD